MPLVLDVSIGGTRVGGEPLFVLVLRDQTERVARERSLALEVTRDPLTGILNRRGSRAPGAVPAAATAPAPTAPSLVIDVDAFKLLNDRHGHAAGDKVLQPWPSASAGAARRRRSPAVRDEFVVALGGVAGRRR
ncbi:MAG: GGDEF domain-containing protein [Geminicoccaceae bacterium]